MPLSNNDKKENKSGNKRDKLTEDEKKYISSNLLIKSDISISEHLQRNIKTIRRYRKSLGIKKSPGGLIDKAYTKGTPDQLKTNKKMTEEDRQNFFRTQLTNSLYYKNLKQQLTEDEMEYYICEHGILYEQFQDVIATENRQVASLIMAEIMGNRILRNIKIAEDELQKVQIEVDEFRVKHPNLENEEEEQARDSQLMNLCRILSGQVAAMTNDYQKNVDLKERLLENLDASRKDRTEQIKKGGTTFIGLVEMLRDRDNREKEGRYLELVRLSREAKAADWRKPKMFPDGKMDPLLLDSESEMPNSDENDIKEVSYLVSKYKDLHGKRILLVSSEKSHYLLFSKFFHANSIELMKEFSEEQVLFNYDLILFNDKLKDTSAEVVIDKILEKDTSKTSDILIFTENADFTKAAMNKLIGKRKVEICPFNEIESWDKQCREQSLMKK